MVQGTNGLGSCMASKDSMESISSRIQIMSYFQNITFTCNVIVIW